jgi:hypothetical protein
VTAVELIGGALDLLVHACHEGCPLAMSDDYELPLLGGPDHLLANAIGISSLEEQCAVLLGGSCAHLPSEQLRLGCVGPSAFSARSARLSH